MSPAADQTGRLVLLRHGETEWSRDGRHTGRTDVPLTEDGERDARALAPRLAGFDFALVLCSPLSRARRTAELAGLDPVDDDDLLEWDYGAYEGRTTAEILAQRPDWSLWTDGGPGGESPDQVTVRVDRLLARVRPLLSTGDVALVGHGHCLRVVAARWIGLPVDGGALLKLDTATLSELGWEHGRPVVLHWNLPAAL
jgi:broad specificity phosphatase PhoE